MTPTLEEVKYYFKNAELIKSNTGTVFRNFDDLFFKHDCYFSTDPTGYKRIVWDKYNGYAEIVEYKESLTTRNHKKTQEAYKMLKNTLNNEEPETVKPRFSVSLVYHKTEGGAQKTALRCIIIYAVSEAEALGLAIKEYESDTENWDLTLKVVIELN